MKNWISLIIIQALILTSCNNVANNGTEKVPLVDYVNPLMGTDSKYTLSNGNTYPAIAVPWGMNFWTPMTSPMGDGWTYKYNEKQNQRHQANPPTQSMD